MGAPSGFSPHLYAAFSQSQLVKVNFYPIVCRSPSMAFVRGKS